MNIERNKECILIKYVNENLKTFKCVITIDDVFVVNFCKKNLERMEKILHNYILEKVDDYYILRVEDPICLEYQLKMEKQNGVSNMELIFEKIQKLEEDNKKLSDRIQRLDKITNELLFENRILREYVPVIDTTIFNIQKEINNTNKLNENERDKTNKIRDVIEYYHEREKVREKEINQLKQRITICELSVKNIKKITDQNMVSILKEIDYIYSLIERSKNLILVKINEIFGKYEGEQTTYNSLQRSSYQEYCSNI